MFLGEFPPLLEFLTNVWIKGLFTNFCLLNPENEKIFLEELVPRIKKVAHRTVTFEVGKENRNFTGIKCFL